MALYEENVLRAVAASTNPDISSQDLTYVYDAAGNRTAEKLVKSGVTIKDQTASYDLLGRMTQWDEAGTTTLNEASKTHQYDANGNIRRTQEFSIGLDTYGQSLGDGLNYDFWFRYDSMNRVVTDKGELSGAAGVGGTTIVRGTNLFGDTNYGRDIQYDRAGQRVAVLTTFVDENNTLVLDGPGDGGIGDPLPPGDTQDPIGDPDGGGGPGGGGTWIDGQGYRTEQRESYTYNDAGQLTEIRTSEGAQQLELANGSGGYDFPTSPPPAAPSGGDLRSRFTYDLLGRQNLEEGFIAGSSNAFHSVETHFNAKGQVIETKSSTWKDDGDTRLSTTRNDFGVGSNYALGQVVQSLTDTRLNNSDSAIPDTALKYTFRWYDSAAQNTVQHDKNYSNNDNSSTHGMTQGSSLSGFDADYTTTHTYNAFGQLTKADVDDGLAHDVNFTLDELGQIILREETRPSNAHSSQLGSPHEMWYRFGGREMGYLSNNGTTEVSANTALNEISRAPSSNAGTFGGGRTYGSPYHDLNNSYDPLNAYYQGSRAGTYTVRGGESLQQIAASTYGDSNLWYKIAEANGLPAGAALASGQILRLPAGVVRTTHNADTFKPYDPGQAIGELSPTTPKPQKGNNCGAFGQILLAVVAVAVTVLAPVSGATFGAAVANAGLGSVASQAVGLYTGIQEKFSFKGVALSALSAGVTYGLGPGGGIFKGEGGAFSGVTKSTALQAGLRGATASAISQGIGTVTGLQSSFSWAGVAAAGVAAGVGDAFDLDALSGEGANLTPGNIASHTAVGAARLFASAATRSAITGSSFGDAVEAGLPDVIGQVIGQVIGGAVSSRRMSATGGGSASASGEPQKVATQLADITDPRIDLPSLQMTGDPVADANAVRASLPGANGTNSQGQGDGVLGLNYNYSGAPSDVGHINALITLVLRDKAEAVLGVAQDLGNGTVGELTRSTISAFGGNPLAIESFSNFLQTYAVSDNAAAQFASDQLVSSLREHVATVDIPEIVVGDPRWAIQKWGASISDAGFGWVQSQMSSYAARSEAKKRTNPYNPLPYVDDVIVGGLGLGANAVVAVPGVVTNPIERGVLPYFAGVVDFTLVERTGLQFVSDKVQDFRNSTSTEIGMGIGATGTSVLLGATSARAIGNARALRFKDSPAAIPRPGDANFIGPVDFIGPRLPEAVVRRSSHPESAQHILDAQAAGHPITLTIDRNGALSNRADSLRGYSKVPMKQLDEYPPAMFREGGVGASVRPISPSDNMGSGASIGNQLRKFPDGTKVRFVVR